MLTTAGPHPAHERQPEPERGSVLLLFPVGVLIVVVLAAVAVDSSIAFLGERELSGAVTAAANDAADALSDPAFYRSGSVQPDPGEAEQVAEDRVRSSLDASRYHHLSVQARVLSPPGGGCSWTIEVTASATVRYLFAPALPGGPDEAHVDARAASRPVQEGTTC